MKIILKIFTFLFICYCGFLNSQSNFIFIRGSIKNEKTSEFIENVAVKNIKDSAGTLSNKIGSFELKLQKKSGIKLHFNHPGFCPFIKEIKNEAKDTLNLTIYLKEKITVLDTMLIYSIHKPETLVGKPYYSIYDFDFFEDKLILLTAKRSLDKAEIQFSDYNGRIISKLQIPEYAGTALSFFHDYEDYTDLICKGAILRLDLMNKEILMMPVSRDGFNRSIKPIADTANKSLYYSDQWDKYPLFNYYYIKQNDTSSNLLRTVCNFDLMKLYNLEYYYLPPAAQLEARRLAQQFKTDKNIIAATMSGFTRSIFYEPIYAPLFVLNDTVCIFNHYTDYIYHFNKQNKLIDSVQIYYHHPKNWREWKRQLFVDEFENKVYAFYSKDGRHYIKQINYQTGKEVKVYKLKNHSAEKIKVRDGFVYYIYRPFDSTQEKFLYREKIE